MAMAASRMMNDPNILTQCIDLDLEFETAVDTQPFRPIRMDSQIDREPSVTFCLLGESVASTLAKPVAESEVPGVPHEFLASMCGVLHQSLGASSVKGLFKATQRELKVLLFA